MAVLMTSSRHSSTKQQQKQHPSTKSSSITPTENSSSSYPSSSISKMTIKRHRRSRNIVVTQMKLIIFLLSLLHIGDSPCWIQLESGCGVSGRVSFLGNVFVMGESIGEIDDTKKKRKVPSSSSGSSTSRSIPEIPTFSKSQKDAGRSLGNFHYDNDDGNNKKTPDNRKKQLAFSDILKKAGKSGIGGGISGAIAGVVQVLSLMWLRTVMNYQCRYGSTFFQALKKLNNQGGIPRFYRGLSFALIQAPLARFVATASNDGVETFLSSFPSTKQWGPGRSTVIASMIVGMWRIFLMPIDTCKTVLQVDSVDGFRGLMRKVKAGKLYVLYNGKNFATV